MLIYNGVLQNMGSLLEACYDNRGLPLLGHNELGWDTAECSMKWHLRPSCSTDCLWPMRDTHCACRSSDLNAPQN
jgi:hypothetical protein